MSRAVVVAVLGLLVAAVGCVAEPTASERDRQVDWGEAVYQWHCARCHDPDRSALELTAEVLVDWEGAQELYEFNRDQMPLDEPGRLPDADYWAVTAHLLHDAGLLDLDADQRLDEETADDAGVEDVVGDVRDRDDERDDDELSDEDDGGGGG